MKSKSLSKDAVSRRSRYIWRIVLIFTGESKSSAGCLWSKISLVMSEITWLAIRARARSIFVSVHLQNSFLVHDCPPSWASHRWQQVSSIGLNCMYIIFSGARSSFFFIKTIFSNEAGTHCVFTIAGKVFRANILKRLIHARTRFQWFTICFLLTE